MHSQAFLPSHPLHGRGATRHRPLHPPPKCAIRASDTPPSPWSRRMPILYTEAFLAHRAPPRLPHPENPSRLTDCVSALKRSPIAHLLDWQLPTPLSENGEVVMRAVEAIHAEPDYLAELARLSIRGGMLDNDTYVAPGSYEVALLAAGAWMRAVDVSGGTRAAWALARPPGHHALPAAGMGFCLLSNAAIAAQYALGRGDGCENVAILDFDVHHGNGTEGCVEGRSGIRYASSHQTPLFPYSGAEGSGMENVMNVGLEVGGGFEVFEERLVDEMLPFLLKDRPEVLIVSAGFDALLGDPLAGLRFLPGDYRRIVERILEAVEGDTRIVFGLEGGYLTGKGGIGEAVVECISGWCLG